MTVYEFSNFQHQGSREEQQDAAGFSDPTDIAVAHAGVLGVLSDGMGGMANGSAAARLAVSEFLKAYGQKMASDAVPSALQRALSAANQAVLNFARANNCERNVGATLVAAVLKDQELYWISAGDSRAYLLRQGSLHRLTVDHTFGEDRWLPGSQPKLPAENQDAIDPEAVSSFVGYPEPPRSDANLRPLRLSPGDTVVLASDGLYKALDESRIASLFNGSLREGCQAAVQAALAQHVADQDNVTVAALRSLSGGEDLRAKLQPKAFLLPALRLK